MEEEYKGPDQSTNTDDGLSSVTNTSPKGSPTKAIVLVVVLIAIIAVAGWFYISMNKGGGPYQGGVNHQIEGVPYYSFYTLYPDYTSEAIAAAMILGYYNDERVTFPELWETFYHQDEYDESTKLKEFFGDLGYNMWDEYSSEVDRGNEISLIKSYIENDAPVLIRQIKERNREDEVNYHPDPLTLQYEYIADWRVITGIFEDKNEIVFHDPTLGNNHTLSFEEFENLVYSDSDILVFWPSETLAAELPEPGKETSYPDEAIDYSLLDETFAISRKAKDASGAALEICRRSIPEDPTDDQIAQAKALWNESIALRDEVINSQGYQFTTPFFKFITNMWKAKSLLRTGKVTGARELIENVLIPSNHDLDQPLPGFEKDDLVGITETDSNTDVVNGQMPYIYELHMLTYRYEGRYDEAIEAYRPYFDLISNDILANRYMAELQDPIQRAREPRGLKCAGGRDMLE